LARSPAVASPAVASPTLSRYGPALTVCGHALIALGVVSHDTSSNP